MSELVDRMVEEDRSARVLERGLWVWSTLIPAVLAVGGVAFGTWLVMSSAFSEGPGSVLMDPYESFLLLFGNRGFVWGAGDCGGWNLLLGCEPEFIPWWDGVDEGFGVGMSVALLLAAWRLPRVARREFGAWEKQQVPLMACLEALVVCRDAFRVSAPDASRLDAGTARLRAALQDFAREGLPADAERKAELEEHSRRVAATLHEAMGRVLRDGTTAELPAVVKVLAQLQDRLYASRWLALVDDTLLTTAPPPPPAPAPGTTPGPAASDAGRWQRYLAIATAMPAIPALLALGFTAMTLAQTRDALRVSERDQVASSYNETVANLGDDSMNVRISSIYALKRMMEESPREQPAIVQVLSAYVRDRAKAPKSKAQIDAAHRDRDARPADDVQAALNVLGKRPGGGDDGEVIDLRHAFLVGADFAAGDFSHADFRGADLTRAYLQDGWFQDVWFSGATMTGATLSGSFFVDAEFVDADLRGIVAQGAGMGDAVLTGADLTGAVLSPQVDEEEVGEGEGAEDESHRPTSLSGADLSGADLTDADLSGALCYGTDFSRDDANDLPAADFTRTNFTDARLVDVFLDGTDRRTAVWDGAVVTE
ncbi:pentapeptide repeat-containing protein [Streptomyces sp. NPDC057271]|uniref:pentapeptide repeat-containing protein n=1 Tax=unclassified Streptomyces TaxID=2593676 RepID=UPI00362AE183